jgi:hypothetical protein
MKEEFQAVGLCLVILLLTLVVISVIVLLLQRRKGRGFLDLSGEDGRPGRDGEPGPPGCSFQINASGTIDDGYFISTGSQPWELFCGDAPTCTFYQIVTIDNRSDTSTPDSLLGDMSGHLIQYSCSTGLWTDDGSIMGAPGNAGGVLDFAEFFAFMSSSGTNDNPSPIIPGDAIAFPNVGPAAAGSAITYDLTGIYANNSGILLPNVGTYLVLFVATAAESGQVVIALDNHSPSFVEQTNYIFGRSATNSQIDGKGVIRINTPNTTLSIRNPQNDNTNLTLTPDAGSGTNVPVTAHLVIMQLA